MSKRADITDAMNWFTGEDRKWRFTIEGVRESIAGWTIPWKVRIGEDAVPTVIEIPTTLIVDGDVDTDPVVEALVASTDTADLRGGTYWHELLRTDNSQRAVLSFGSAVLKKAGLP